MRDLVVGELKLQAERERTRLAALHRRVVAFMDDILGWLIIQDLYPQTHAEGDALLRELREELAKGGEAPDSDHGTGTEARPATTAPSPPETAGPPLDQQQFNKTIDRVVQAMGGPVTFVPDDERATLLAENAGLRGLLERVRPMATALAEALAGPEPTPPHGYDLYGYTAVDVARLVEAARRVMNERWNTVLTTPDGRDPAMRLDIALKAMDDALAPWHPKEAR